MAKKKKAKTKPKKKPPAKKQSKKVTRKAGKKDSGGTAKKEWNDLFYIRIYEWTKQGLSQQAMAEHLGVSMATFSSWMKERPDLTLIVKEAQDQKLGVEWEHLKSKQRSFLVAYVRTGTILGACSHTGCDRKTPYRWLAREKNAGTDTEETSFTVALEEAKKMSTELLSMEARRRAMEGTRRYKFHQGQVIMIPCLASDPEAIECEDLQGKQCFMKPYVEHEYSDTLMIFLLKAGDPDTYRDKPIKIGGDTTTFNLTQVIQQAESKDPQVIDADFINKAAKNIAEEKKDG